VRLPRPPRLARWLVSLCAPPDDAHLVLDDLAEEYVAREVAEGSRAARRWYWSQAIRSTGPLLVLRARRGRTADRHHRRKDGMFTELTKDVRHALRRAGRNRLLSAAVVTTVALGIGATAAVVAVARDVVFDPLPFPEPHELVRVMNRRWQSVSVVDVRDRAALSRTLEGIAGYTSAKPTWTGPGEPQRLQAALVSGGFGSLLGIQPVLGRHFRPEELVPGGPPVVMLSHGFWQQRFGGETQVLGRQLLLDDVPHEIVGVLPHQPFQFPPVGRDLWLPLVPRPGTWQTMPGANWLIGVARLRDGVSLETAQREMDTLTPRLIELYPELASSERNVNVVPLRDHVVGPVRPIVLLLGSIVAVVLLIACGNVGNLLLADAEARRQEFAVRAALGGSGGHLARQVAVEAGVLATAGGVMAILVAHWMVHGLLALYPGGLPRAGEVELDGRLMLGTLAVTLVVGLLAGLPLIRQAFQGDLVRALRRGEGRLARTPDRTRTVLASGQVALAVLLLIGAGLLLKSFRELSKVEPGYDPDGVLTFAVSVPRARYATDAQVTAFYELLASGIREVPGVRSAGVALGVPLTWAGWTNRLLVDGRPDAEGSGPPTDARVIGPGYLETLGIPLRAGRSFTERDDAEAPPVVLVNERAVAEAFGGRSPLGARIPWEGKVREVVGVVGDVRHASLTEPAVPEVYSPSAQLVRPDRYVAVRAHGDPATLLPALRDVVARLDRSVALSDVATMRERLAEHRAPARFRAALTGTLGGLALVLAVLGIYSSMAYLVQRRSREIGIRIALGARPAAVRRLVLLRALALSGAGAAVGIAAALAATPRLQAFFFGVTAHDAQVVLGAPLLLVLVATFAAWVPARRASCVDPAVAMRVE
jgi:putative ABC transport system permease protein